MKDSNTERGWLRKSSSPDHADTATSIAPERKTQIFEEIKFSYGSEVATAVVPATLSLPVAAAKKPTGVRILIAEDDPVSCQVLAMRLQKMGYDAVITRDGSEAMTVMRAENAPVLAIIDWMMPGMDGLEVCRRLRDIDKVVYIIFLTARGAKENVLEALQAGADDYLVKPFDPLELQGRIHVGFRIINLQKALTERLTELAATIGELTEAKALLNIPL